MTLTKWGFKPIKLNAYAHINPEALHGQKQQPTHTATSHSTCSTHSYTNTTLYFPPFFCTPVKCSKQIVLNFISLSNNISNQHDLYMYHWQHWKCQLSHSPTLTKMSHWWAGLEDTMCSIAAPHNITLLYGVECLYSEREYKCDSAHCCRCLVKGCMAMCVAFSHSCFHSVLLCQCVCNFTS